MNKSRRDELSAIGERITACVIDLEAVRDEEQEAYDNMPESLQRGDQGSAAEGTICALEEALNHLYDASNNIAETQA